MNPCHMNYYHVNSCHRNSYLSNKFVCMNLFCMNSYIFWYYIFHNCLSNVWRAFESHQESQVLVFTKWCDDGTVVLTFVVKLKCIELHTNLKFSKKLVPRMLVQNVRDYRQWILLTSYDFVQLTWVANPAYSVVLLWNGEWGWCPFTLL